MGGIKRHHSLVMKRNSLLSPALGALLALTLAASARAYTWGGKLDMLVVAEQTDASANSALPTAAQPVSYVAFDGGYIEAGDPIGGLQPPSAAAVAQALATALATRHYQAAAGPTPPSLLLVYHWGLLARDTKQIRTAFQLQPNLAARINLVAPAKYAARISEDLLDRRQPATVRVPILDPRERDLIEFAADDRYFVIVSAYDFASVARGDAKLLWRVKLSTRSPGVALADAVPTLLQGGAPFFGRDLAETQFLSPPLVATASVPAAPVTAPPPDVLQALNQTYLNTLIHQEHVQFTGDLPAPR